MEHNNCIEYKNIKIRQLEREDIEFLREWRNNSENTKYLRQIPYITSEMQQRWYCSYLEDKDEMTFAIDEVEEIGRIVGCMSLYNFEGKRAEFGKILIGEPMAHGKNVGVNALIALMSLSREVLKLDQLYLHVYKDNTVAIRVYEKAGFKIKELQVDYNGMEEYVMTADL